MDMPAEAAHTEPGGTPEPRGTPRVTLLTDFGTRDGYVAAMRGVLATLAPAARVEDAAHDVPPGDIRHAAFALQAYWRRYPPGTIHLVVVDPGVGAARRALVGAADGRLLVAPDNGVLGRVLAAAGAAELHAIENPEFMGPDVSATFHGRDVFAPAAAHLARGVPPDRFGAPVEDPVPLDVPAPLRSEGVVQGEVVHVDRFGTLVSNIPAEWVERDASVSVEDKVVGGVWRTYADVEPGQPVALIGSAGLLEVAVRNGSASRALGCERGAEVTLTRA
ncbi:MAG: SAM-dependent chlorinase/fluorinase [Gemmatimonadota bacterium]